MPAEFSLHWIGQLAFFQSESGLLELVDHHAVTKGAQIAAILL